jgi:hypothetical protein
MSVATDAVLAPATVSDPLVDGAGAFWADAPAEPVLAEAGAGRPTPPLPRPAPVPAWPCELAPELRRERLRPGCGWAVWKQFCCVVRLASPRAGCCAAVELVGRQVGVALFAAGAVVVVVIAGVVVVSVGADVCCVMVPVVVAPVGRALADWAPRAAVVPPIQPFSALDMASVLASSDRRERQPARALWARSLRCIQGTFGRSPEC